MSNIVYQGHAGGLDAEAIREAVKIATCGIQPDLTLVLDIDLETVDENESSLDRLESRGNAYREKVRSGCTVSKPNRRVRLYRRKSQCRKKCEHKSLPLPISFPDPLNC